MDQRTALLEIYWTCLHSRDDVSGEIEEIIEQVIDRETLDKMREKREEQRKKARERALKEDKEERILFAKASKEGPEINEYGERSLKNGRV